ncbi:uncharacterized protein [Drosophila virilis]|uniref:Uncharacterized protein n=1 Tax=Drosophila virilis TaxID=7244 RepID=B4MAB4_DROVI|nr:uncharacterized protein LOC6634516 [Drosophila virilis]EDW66173.1 uncharacterized protein Dvir_GJ15877 [Drosophila virilis]
MDRATNTNRNPLYASILEPRRRRVIFELAVAPESHISPRPEDNGAAFRRFVLDVPNPLDKRLLIVSLLNGPADANFRSLMVELNGGLQEVLRAEAEAEAAKEEAARVARPIQIAYKETSVTPALELEGGSSTDTSSETEHSH